MGSGDNGVRFSVPSLPFYAVCFFRNDFMGLMFWQTFLMG